MWKFSICSLLQSRYIVQTHTRMHKLTRTNSQSHTCACTHIRIHVLCMCTHYTIAYSKQLSINEYAILFGYIKNATELNQFIVVLFSRQCSLLRCNFMTIVCYMYTASCPSMRAAVDCCLCCSDVIALYQALSGQQSWGSCTRV